MKYSPEQIKESRAYRELYNSNIPDRELTEILENLQFNLGDGVLFSGNLDSDLITLFDWMSSQQGSAYWAQIWERM